MKFAFIAAEKATYPVTVLCRMLEVSRAGFYAAQGRAPSARARADTKLGVEIAAIHAESRQCYGSPRVQAELRARGHGPSRKRVARLMRQQGLAARRRRRFRVTTDSNHARPVAANVVARQFAGRPRRDLGDRHHVHLDGGGMGVPGGHPRPVLAAVVGWALSARITQDLALEALGMALARRRPPQGLVHHSDRGSQYASAAYQARLAQHGIRASMSRRGNCWDNAVAESFFATLKVELVHGVTWATRVGAHADLFDYLEILSRYAGDLALVC